jgi:hypothetical protein
MDARAMTLLFILGCADAGGELNPPPLSLSQDLRIDGDTLPDMSDIIILPNGTMVVNHDAEAYIRYFAADGRQIATFGRQGDGPGEFMRIRYIGSIGDSVWAFDVRRSSMTYITPDYRLARSFMLKSAAPPPELQDSLPKFPFIYIRAAYSGGEYLVLGDPAAGVQLPSKYPRAMSPYLRISDSGLVRRVITWQRDDAGTLNVIVPGQGVFGASVPFMQDDVDAFSPDGSRVAMLQTEVHGKSGGVFRVTMIGETGDTVFVREYPFRGVPIPPAIIDSAWQESLRRARLPPHPPQVAAALMQAGPPPPVYPPIYEMLVGRDGSTWIRMRKPGVGPSQRYWLVLDSNGEPYGSVTTPANIRISTADLSTFWGFEADSNDVESIVRYRVAKR